MAIESKMSRGPIGRPLGQPEEKPKKSSFWIWAIAILLILVGGFIWWYKTQSSQPGSGSDTSISEPIKEGEYHAVFLDNGQVYFGKLKLGGEFYQLTDVFYLQAGTGQLDQAANLSLTKLGNEAHGPQDKMEINKAHVLFYEAMKSDSKVAQAIQSYKSKKQ